MELELQSLWHKIAVWGLYIFYWAWVSRRREMKLMKWTCIFSGLGLFLGALLVYYRTNIALGIFSRSEFLLYFLFLSAVLCFLTAIIFALRDWISRPKGGKTIAASLPPRERLRFRVEVLVGVFLFVAFLLYVNFT